MEPWQIENPETILLENRETATVPKTHDGCLKLGHKETSTKAKKFPNNFQQPETTLHDSENRKKQTQLKFHDTSSCFRQRKQNYEHQDAIECWKLYEEEFLKITLTEKLLI